MPRVILIVEDDKINRMLLRNMLDKEYDVLEAENGQEALSILTRKYKLISAVLLDLIMPVMDGYTLLSKMRDNIAFAQIPVIVTTGAAQEEAEVKALSLGANDFVAKPYNPTLIRHCLRNTINLRETASIVNAMERDKLTGLYNRAAFFDKSEAILRAHEPGAYVMACFDIRNFKLINDRYGATEGDRTLQYIGHIVRADMAKAGGIGSRISDDNFAVLYPARHTGVDFTIRLQENNPSPALLQAVSGISIGRYIVTDLSLSAASAYDRAYIAKQSIKGRYDRHMAYFSESMREKLIREQEIISDMDAALAQRQFAVFFQPQFNHATGALIGAEALVRWRHPHRGVILPNQFIPVFERNGFIYELDKYVWEQVCVLLRRWLDEGRRPLPVSVNISRYDIFRADLIDVITGLVKKYAVPVELLRLEITESAFAKSAEQIIAVVKELMDRGFTLEIDDFGSGYSSLNTLKDVPANVLKLDMRFLENDENSQRGGNILESVVRMAKWLDMAVIAEGVETIAQADYLKSIGCNYVQGYLYARPMPVEEYEALTLNAGKEQRLLALETVENLDNNAFWDPKSIDTLIFNSYIGGACIYEYHNGRIELLRANDKYMRMIGSVGMTVEDALKLNWMAHLDEKNRAAVLDALLRSIETGDEITAEFVFLRLPGCPEKTYLRSSMRVIASTGDRYLVYCTNENMTAQREAEEKERRASEQTQIILDDVGSGITAAVGTGTQTRFLLANDKYYDILGFTRRQYEAEVANVYELVHPEDQARVRQIVSEAYEQAKPAKLEYRVRRRDGETRWVRALLSPTRFTGVEQPVQLCVFSDITAEKQAEQALEETDEQLRFLNDTAHDLLAQPDCEKGIEDTLWKLLDYFGGGRAYIFEFDYEKRIADNTYEVCAPGVKSEKESLRSVPMEVMAFWLHAFDRQSYVDIADVSQLDESRAAERQTLSAQGIQSLVAVPLRRDGALIGFIGIDDPSRQQAHVNRLNAIGDYIAVMLTRRDLNARISSDNQALAELMRDTPGGFVRMRIFPDGRIAPVYINDGFCKLTGMTHKEAMALYEQDAMAGVHPDDIGIVQDAVAQMLSEGKARSSKYRLRCGGGGYLWMMIFGRASRNEAGDVYLNIYYIDISEQSGAQTERADAPA